MQHNLEHCPACGGPLEQGYLLGKQSRIRWSVSPRGMTILHGIPLIRLEDGFWRKRQWWSYAPSIPASRCTACRLAVFAYNNDAQENPANERRASVTIGILLFLVAATIGGLVLLAGPAIPLAWRVVPGVLALLPLLLGGMLLRHALRYFRSG
jgi:hypothetical protein